MLFCIAEKRVDDPRMSLINRVISFYFSGVEFGPLHYRTLEHDKNFALRRSRGNFDAPVTWSFDSIDDLDWWIKSLSTAIKTIDHKTPELILNTDASQIGWGASFLHAKTQGIWTDDEKQCYINKLELLAIKFGLQSLLTTVHDTHIRIQSDSTTAVSYITSMGGCLSKECDSIARDIWAWAIKRQNWLSAAFLPGKQNITANLLSLNFNSALEWRLDSSIFQKISSHFGVPSIDLFASRVNHQLDKYVAWKPDAGAKYTDAFSLNWAQINNGFAFPPFCLVNRCLQKIVEEKATLIFVVPMWPTPRLLTLLILYPRIVPVTKNVLTNPLLPRTHPLKSNLTLMACKVSGDTYLTTTFLRTLPPSLFNPGDQVLRNSIPYTSIDGPNFVTQGKLIQCYQL